MPTIDKPAACGSEMTLDWIWMLAMPMLFRRHLLTLIAAIAFVAPGFAHAEDKVGDQELALGNARAAVTVIEYASITCTHCAHFNADVFPAFKARYIDTGLVRYVLRETPINPREDAAGFMVARCSGLGHYFKVTDALFRNQTLLFDRHDLHAWLMAGASAGGLNEDQMKACIVDAKAIEAFNARGDRVLNVDKIDSTPTVVVNGKRIDPPGGRAISVADLDAAIQPLLPVKHQTARRPVHKLS
jgi:protein-disulfide isomerase